MITKSFNTSIWNALWILCPFGGIIFWVAYTRVNSGHFYFFDPKHNTDQRLNDAGDYGPHFQRYQDLSKLVIALSAGAIAFLINLIASDKTSSSVFVQRMTAVAPIVVGYFAASVGFLIAFMLLQTLWYEEYSHSPTHITYKAWKYALCTGLGFTGLVSFILGFGWLAANLFS